MIPSSLTGMCIQFRTLTFHSVLEEQLQEQISIKESMSLLRVAIRLLGSPLEPHPKIDLAINLYSDSTPITDMDESDHRISFNRLKKYVTYLPATIEALGSPLEPHLESDLVTYLYSGCTPIGNMDESNRWIRFNHLNKSAISLTIGLSYRTHLERDLAIYLYSVSSPIAIKDESNCWISFRRVEQIYNITTRGDQGIWLSSKNPSENRSHYRSILWLYPSSQLRRDGSI
jgi:hypothetical protein